MDEFQVELGKKTFFPVTARHFTWKVEVRSVARNELVGQITVGSQLANLPLGALIYVSACGGPYYTQVHWGAFVLERFSHELTSAIPMSFIYRIVLMDAQSLPSMVLSVARMGVIASLEQPSFGSSGHLDSATLTLETVPLYTAVVTVYRPGELTQELAYKLRKDGQFEAISVGSLVLVKIQGSAEAIDLRIAQLRQMGCTIVNRFSEMVE